MIGWETRNGGSIVSIQELETEALKLPEEERARLAERLLASIGRRGSPGGADPIFGLGRAPVSCGTSDGAADHDRYLYDSAQQ
jgi:hypothetical protein